MNSFEEWSASRSEAIRLSNAEYPQLVLTLLKEAWYTGQGAGLAKAEASFLSVFGGTREPTMEMSGEKPR